jgi:hypothetical protein
MLGVFVIPSEAKDLVPMASGEEVASASSAQAFAALRMTE